MNALVSSLIAKAGHVPLEESRMISDTVWNALPTTNGDLIWRYYNFTSTSSIWDSDEEGERSYVEIGYAESGKENISNISFVIGGDPSPYAAALAALKERLIREFDLIERKC